ncbi:hypothetical protein F3Y22_tig00117005pilonHSYRG00425 [Hibiscus syriacus]|uniref:MULE transposase domain-containing protein n=1 Tax=Hibiscus syriacus TaxID=106335 RepID=A0A6A2WDC2_HIBSY|nr:hypothetical protein F3Y22_tig00117005pilonHSYRG00425 [Hibiscus syriacus]
MDHTDADNVKPTKECHEEFAREHGFSARKGTTRLDVEGNVKTQEFCCSKEGAVSKADIDEARALKEVGVGMLQVMNYLTQQAGGYHNVGFTYKNLYNALQRGKVNEIVNGDVNALIAYFDYKKLYDPEFFMAYSVDESGALYNLIWSDSTSRSDYTCFGDVIAFDTTYKDNLYSRPIMPIVGINHHHNTIVFATVIIADETSQFFEWVLQNFLEAMMNKSPISVVTDGDRAMQRAIKSIIPYAKHKLCYCHISRNAQANIEFNVEKHPWVIEKGNTRYLWAQAYLTSHFFANIRSTQRCESMNASLAIALKHKKTYLDVVRAIEDEISRMRMNELKADYLSSRRSTSRSQNWFRHIKL